MDKELLYRFFRNEVSQEEAFAVQEWMESSEEARETFFAERRLFDTLILGVEPVEKGRLFSLRLLRVTQCGCCRVADRRCRRLDMEWPLHLVPMCRIMS